jgi:MFS family permease
MNNALTPAAGSNKDRLILMAGLITYGVGQTLLIVIFGPMARELGLTDLQFGALISASNLVIIFSSPRWGLASNRLGRRSVFAIGLVGFALGYAGFALGIQAGMTGTLSSQALSGLTFASPLFLTLLGARLLYGVFAGAVNPAAAAYMADTTDKASRAQGMAMVAASGGIGSILGPMVGGLLAELHPLVPFYVVAVFAILTAVWARAALVEPIKHVAPEAGPKLRFTDRRVFPYLFGWFIIFLVFTGIQTITAFFVKDQLGVDGQQNIIRVTSMAVFCMALVTVIVQIVVMQMLKLQPRMLLRAAIIAFGLSLWLLSLADNIAMLFFAYGMMGLTASFVMPSLSAAASLSVEPHEQGAAAGLITAAPAVGMIFGPFLAAASYTQNPLLPMYLGGAVMVLTGIGFWFVKTPLVPDE